MKAGIICFQETHIRQKEEKYINSMFKGQIFHAPALTKQKRGYDFYSTTYRLGGKKVLGDEK